MTNFLLSKSVVLGAMLALSPLCACDGGGDGDGDATTGESSDSTESTGSTESTDSTETTDSTEGETSGDGDGDGDGETGGDGDGDGECDGATLPLGTIRLVHADGSTDFNMGGNDYQFGSMKKRTDSNPAAGDEIQLTLGLNPPVPGSYDCETTDDGGQAVDYTVGAVNPSTQFDATSCTIQVAAAGEVGDPVQGSFVATIVNNGGLAPDPTLPAEYEATGCFNVLRAQ